MRTKLIYLIIACIAAVGAGAAVGTVLQGVIQADIAVTVSQALSVEEPTVTEENGTAWPHRYFTSVSDDGVNFTAAVEAYAKETFVINLPMWNHSSGDLYAELSLSIPSGLTVDVDGSGTIPDANVARTGATTWKFPVPAATADGTPPSFDGIKIIVGLPSNITPGFYNLTGEIRLVEY